MANNRAHDDNSPLDSSSRDTVINNTFISGNQASPLTDKEVEQYLANNSAFTQKYFDKYSNFEYYSESQKPRMKKKISWRRNTVVSKPSKWSPIATRRHEILPTYEGFESLSKSSSNLTESEPSRLNNLNELNEHDLLIELAMDIASDLDLVPLCTKIMHNVSTLMRADRTSLFLVEGSGESRKLVSKVFDIKDKKSISDSYDPSSFPEIVISWGSGIIGHVAETGNTVSTPNAYTHPKFNSDVDARTHYITKSVLSMPIKMPRFSESSDVIAVAMAINKKNNDKEIIPFSQEDERIFEKFLTFCGIGIRNAQRFERVQDEDTFKLNLLNLAEILFDDISQMDIFSDKLMKSGNQLLECERCSLYIINSKKSQEDGEISFTEVYLYEPLVNPDAISLTLPLTTSIASIENRKISSRKVSELANQHQKLALVQHVATSGKLINLSLPSDHVNPEIDNINSTDTSVLVMPIYGRVKQVLGVAQFVNRTDKKPFNECDEINFGAFATFCGLGMQHIKEYEEAQTLLAQQKVTIEQLTYHIVVDDNEVDKLAKTATPCAYDLGLVNFDYYFHEANDDSITFSLSMFKQLDLMKKMRIKERNLLKFLLSLRKNYRKVRYHNWCHAYHVANSIFACLVTGGLNAYFTDIEKLALMIAAIAHDVDHRGTNNKFQQETKTPLFDLYNTSTMERHHYQQCVLILQCDGHQILSELEKSQYSSIIKIIQKAILATDLAIYFEKRQEFFELVANNSFDPCTNAQHKDIFISMLMTASDLSSITKPWEVQYEVAYQVAEEFWEQGDKERDLGKQPHPIMDRQRKDDLPKLQVGFIDSIAMPLYKSLAKFAPRLTPMLEGCQNNRSKWVELDAEHSRVRLATQIIDDSLHW